MSYTVGPYAEPSVAEFASRLRSKPHVLHHPGYRFETEEQDAVARPERGSRTWFYGVRGRLSGRGVRLPGGIRDEDRWPAR